MTRAGREPDAPVPRETIVGALVVAVAFAGLAAWSWRKWTDVQVDFGVELYVPWRIALGEALYRDIATRNGPLSHYVNALGFAVFGPSLSVLVASNLAILAAICAMTWKLFRDACGARTATVCALVLLAVFGFSQYTPVANFNYVTPYQHPQTHGLALSIGMTLACTRALRTREPRDWGLAGALFGLVLLTKIEIAVPAAAVALAAFGLLSAAHGARPLAFAAFGGAAALPVAAATALLAAQMPLATAWEGVLGNLPHLGPALARDPFYLRTMGIDDAGSNALAAATALAAVVGFAVAAALADSAVPVRVARSRAVVAAAFGVGFVALAALPIDWFALARALPLATLAIGLPLGWTCVRALRRHDGQPPRRVGLALWAVLAFALLGKVFLNARFGHYGFVLAMPATLLVVAALTDLAPRALARRLGRRRPDGPPPAGAVARAVGTGAVAAFALSLLVAAQSHYRGKTFAVGAGPDRILAHDDRRARVVAAGLARLDALLPRDATLLVWPEGVLVNYWLRRDDPSRYTLFLPSELDAYGEARVFEDVVRSRPDFVVVLHRDAADFGGVPFGSTVATGRRFVEWLDRAYERVERIGAEPFTGAGPGLVILRRRADPS